MNGYVSLEMARRLKEAGVKWRQNGIYAHVVLGMGIGQTVLQTILFMN